MTKQKKNILVIVDMQEDFIRGSLGTKEAVNIVDYLCDKIKNFKGLIIATRDSHEEDYLETSEGKRLPVEHCIKGTKGHQIDEKIMSALIANQGFYKVIDKPTFGSTELIDTLKEIAEYYEIKSIEMDGLCTDICVVSNILMAKANFYEIPIVCDSKGCAGVSVETHDAALATMNMCQITVV